MGKVTGFLGIVFVIVIVILSFFNKDSVDLTVWYDVSYHLPLIALILISAASGIGLMALVSVVRDTKRYLENWQIQRRNKKEKKTLDAYATALEAYHASRFEESGELFNRVIQDAPSHVDAMMRLGDIALHQRDFSSAREWYLRAKGIRPRSIEVLLALANVAESQQRWQDMLKSLDDILEIDSQNLTILYRKRTILERQEQWGDLLDLQNKILKCKLPEGQEQEESKRLLCYKYELARHYLKLREKDKAVKSLKSVIKADPKFVAAYLVLYDAYSKNGNPGDAEDILLKGFDATSALIFLAKLEEHYIAEGEPGTIIDLYQKAIQNDQKDMRLQFLLAKLYYRLEMIDYAYNTVQSIDVSSFDYPGLHALMGSIYERRSELQKAVNEFRKALHADAAFLVPYSCSHCHYTSKKWAGQCPECMNWNTFDLDLNEVFKAEKRQRSS